MQRIAIVEDQARLAELIRQALGKVGIEADAFGTLASAWHAATHADYAALLIDRGLPDGDGLSLLRSLRAAGRMTPCLMLTARDAVHDRIEGLESGADDYLTKPFAMDELVARVRALMRRPASVRPLAPALGELCVDPDESCMRHGTGSISLAPAELQIMLTLVRAQGRTIRHTALEHAAWGYEEAVTPNALDVALHRLRKKLAAINATLKIVNLRGHGYALHENTLAP